MMLLADVSSGIRVIHVGQVDPVVRMREDVRSGLEQSTQKWISPSYFYDEAGADIYEAITRLPEYYPTRTEAAILQEMAPWLGEHLLGSQIIELGSGSSAKTRILLDAFYQAETPLTYVPIDINEASLADSTKQLSKAYPRLNIQALVGHYDEAMDYLSNLSPVASRLFLFLGSTLGNFPPQAQSAFFERFSRLMRPGDHLLLGVDRMPHANKPASVIEEAYNDALGVTAEFNLNMLTHLNRMLGADFDLSQWEHQAVYNGNKEQIEMYLISQADQTVTIRDLEAQYRFEAGERLLTEISRKYDMESLAHWFLPYRLQCMYQWSDPDELFGLMLLKKA